MTTTDTDDGLVRLVLLLVASFVLAPVILMALLMPTMGMMGWWGMHGWSGVGMDAPMTGVAFLAPLLWLMVVLGVGYLLYRRVARWAGSESEDGALEELRLAYARGDLSHDEYEERRERLERDAESSE